VGDRVKFRDDARAPFRIPTGTRLIVREVSASGAVRISLEPAGVWVKGELLELADDAVGKEEEGAR